MLAFLIVITLICAAVVFYKNANYWKYKNVKHIKPWTVLGSFGKNLLRQVTFVDQLQYLYNYHPDAKFVGTHQFTKPMLLIKDPEIIKQICVKSFTSFMNRNALFSEDIDPLIGKILFVLKGQKWRDMRSTLSPAFTSSKMRAMYILIKDCTKQFCNFYAEKVKNYDVYEVEMKNIFTRYTNDVIATSAFGITCDSLRDENNEFYKAGQQILKFGGISTTIKFISSALMPNVTKFFRITILGKTLSDFFRNTVKSTMEYREKNNIVRPDMIHLLMEAQKGHLKHEKQKDDDAGFATVEESDIGKEENKNKSQFTDDDFIAQAVVFFLAGFDGSSTFLSFLAHELAVNVDVQQKLQDEIDQNFKKCNGDMDYETLLKMKYLDMVISEGLRKWPPAPITERICTQDFTLTDGDKSVVIEKGLLVMMPVYSLQHDPKYFPDPEKFDPERFNDDNKNNINPFTFMPFGQGPRNCIGSRFALLQIKSMLAHLLLKFDITVVEKTQVPMKLAKVSFNMQPEKGFWLGLKLRK